MLSFSNLSNHNIQKWRTLSCQDYLSSHDISYVLITRAAQVLEIEMPAEQSQTASCFDDEEVGGSLHPFSVPQRPDLEELVLRQLNHLNHLKPIAGQVYIDG